MSLRCSGLVLLLPCLLFTCAISGAFAAPGAEQLEAAIAAGQVHGQNFAQLQAPGLTITQKDLSGILLPQADLRGSVFREVSLDGANLQQANLRGVIFDRVSLVGTDLSSADLNGAFLRLVDLSEANLSDTKLAGCTFENPLTASNGASHLASLRQALQQATRSTLSRSWVAGLSGDAFAFVYNTENAAFWPCSPFTVNPLLAAPRILGVEARLRQDYFARQALTDPKPETRLVQMVALRLPQAQVLAPGQTLWGVVTGREVGEKATYYVVNVPPFGLQTCREDTLLAQWTGPFENLEPIGSLRLIENPLLALTPKSRIPLAADQARAALRQAVAIITDKRTYGPLVPGEAGLLRLAQDLRSVAQSGDTEMAQRLGVWGDYPRQCVLGSLKQACDFLNEAQVTLPADRQPAVQGARKLYNTVAETLSTEWPDLALQGGAVTPDVKDRYNKAADIIAALAAAEHKAADLFTQAAAE